MNGAALLTYVQRRLAENGLTLEAGRNDDLFDAITEGRDEVLSRLALVAPTLFSSTITLEVDSADLNTYQLPAATRDPIRTAGLFLSVSGADPLMLTPSAQLGRDEGEYVLTSPRVWQLRSNIALGTTDTLQVVAVLAGTDIVTGTTEAGIGLPTPCHRAIGKFAAVLALTADEESDAGTASGLFEREMDRLESQYGSYDINDGMKLRHALMASAGLEYGDMMP